MELTPLTPAEADAIHARGLGLGRDASPWDFVAEAWRSALWALCHPHWQPASTQRLTSLFLDLAGSSASPSGMEEPLAVRDHLVAVGDLVRLPGGEWLPAPLKLVVNENVPEPRIIGGMPSWVMASAHPQWLGAPGLLRAGRQGLQQPTLALDEWCSRDAPDQPVRTLKEAIARLDRIPAVPWTPTSDLDLKNRALPNPAAPPVGAWIQVRDRLTHRLVGVAEKGPAGWSLRSQPSSLDGRMVHLACQARQGTFERWQAHAEGRETILSLWVQLPGWHWQVLLCCCRRPPFQDPRTHRWTAVIGSQWLESVESHVFTPLQMLKA